MAVKAKHYCRDGLIVSLLNVYTKLVNVYYFLPFTVGLYPVISNEARCSRPRRGQELEAEAEANTWRPRPRSISDGKEKK